MRFFDRAYMGYVTSTLWIGVGLYMVFFGISTNWRLIGGAVVAIGILRAVMAVRERKARQQAAQQSQQDDDDESPPAPPTDT